MGGLVTDLVGRSGQPHLFHHAAGEGAAVHVARALGVPAHYAQTLALMLGELAVGLLQTGVILGEKGFGFGVPVQHVGAAIEDLLPGVTPVAGDDGGGDLFEQGQQLGLSLAGEDEIRFQIDQLLQVEVVQIADHGDLLARLLQ